jgi:superfamily I DNA and/or RNA helicase
VSYSSLFDPVVPSVMLDVQYRMHPAISRFPAQEFYDSALINGTQDLLGNISPGLDPPNSKHLINNLMTGHRPSVVFIDHTGNESKKGRSLVNVMEGHIVASVVEDLLLNNEVGYSLIDLINI